MTGYDFPNIKVTSIEKNELGLNVQVRLINEILHIM